MNKILFVILFLSLYVSSNALLADDDNEARSIYQEAKKLCVEQKWIEAINTFENIIDQYSESRYIDDANFWIGYCLEKLPQRQTDAFSKFEQVVSKFPNSPWADDAAIHQITLAEQFVMEGKEQYKSFLTRNIKSENQEIRNRAALALGRLGDKSALPILNKLSEDEDFGPLASNLVAVFERRELDKSESIKTDSSQISMDVIYKAPKRQTVKEDEDKDFFSLFSSQRYEQYKSMLRKDDDWSPGELNDFALWHILDTDYFQEYISLSNEYDKKEWIRKYWKSLDPTPTTEKNELKEELDLRIIHARAHFSTSWNNKHFKYLPDQHLRDGWDHAPWDARGELYIKYGEPDIRSVEGWHTEEWIYYKFGVDFIVKQYMTNIYGNAITGGTISQRRYGSGDRGWNIWEPYLQANFIYKNEIKYEYNYDAEPVEDLELEIITNNKNVVITYTVPIDEFFISEDQRVIYNEELVIFDEDYLEIKRLDSEQKIKNSPELDDTIIRKIEMELSPGEYTVAIRLKDLNSNKLGIYKSVLTVGN